MKTQISIKVEKSLLELVLSPPSNPSGRICRDGWGLIRLTHCGWIQTTRESWLQAIIRQAMQLVMLAFSCCRQHYQKMCKQERVVEAASRPYGHRSPPCHSFSIASAILSLRIKPRTHIPPMASFSAWSSHFSKNLGNHQSYPGPATLNLYSFRQVRCHSVPQWRRHPSHQPCFPENKT